MDPDEFKRRMEAIASKEHGLASNTEARHGEADELLCEALEDLGYEEGVRIFREMEKWYT